MEYWKKNVRALAYKNKKLADEIECLIRQDEIHHVKVKELENSEKILTVERDGYTWRLNSGLDPEGAAGLYADRYQMKPFYRYFIFGFSDGRAIRKLLEQCDNSNFLIICEPDKEILAEALRQYDLEDLLSDDRVWPCVFDMWEELCAAILWTVDYSHIKLVEFCILPGYDVLYTKECECFMDEVVHEITRMRSIKETDNKFDRILPRNTLFHMKNMIGQRNFGQVRQALRQSEAEDIPAIIVAAGPSLDKNIKELKQAEGRAVLFVVDAALRSVIREGIEPDFVCTVDPKAPERFYETVGDREFLWCCCGWTNPVPIQKHGKKVFYYDSTVPWWDAVIQNELNCQNPIIESGGSVSAEAFQLARFLGFQTIIFVGQDLAFTGGQSHTAGIKGVLGNNEDYIRSRHLVQVEGIDGEPLVTDFQMNFYRQWFEKKIQGCGNGMSVIDATEGGARIKGSRVMSLKEAIALECRHETDLHSRFYCLPPAFSGAQQEFLHKKLKELEEWKTDFYRQINQGIFIGERLLEEMQDLESAVLSVRLKEMLAQNERIEKHPFAAWAEMYAKGDEENLWEDILAKEDMEIAEMIERNIRLLQSYQAGIPLFEEDYRGVFTE